jgi:hypothetical protein
MGNKEVNLGKGCLPLFIVVIILFVLRLQLAPGKPWEKEFTDFTVALYWIGVVYMLLVVISNKLNESEPKIFNREIKATVTIDERKKNIEQIEKLNEKKRLEDSKLQNLKNSWASHNEYLILCNDTLLDLLDENPIESINYSMLLSCFEWKFKRFKIIFRDNFQCQDCNEKSSELHVHHNYYIKDSMPWEIDDSALTSLCKKCHTKRHEKENIKVYKKYNGQLIITGHYYLKCQRCNGTGYLPQFKHVEDGICFLCHGNVLSETIFSDRLKAIKADKEKYDIKGEKNSLENFMNSITVEYFSSQINQKLFDEIDSFFINDYDNNRFRSNKPSQNSDKSNDSSEDLPF